MASSQNYSPFKCPLSIHPMSALCDHNGRIITSDYGIKLTIPKDAIKKGDLVTFSIAADFYGPFVLPSKCQTDLVSPFYWIRVSESYHFTKPIKVEFEHSAVICNPSHFYLLTCKDDDKTYTMQPSDCEVTLTIQDDKSLCVFETYHFCSYCLNRGCTDPLINRIVALYLKPKDFQYSDRFSVQIWFSFTTSYCIKRNIELYTNDDLVLDKKCSCNIEVCCTKDSTSYFELSYHNEIDDWCMNHSRLDKIKTKEINFYNYYTDAEGLKAHENMSLFPPRFIVNVTRNPECNKDLDTNIMINLKNNGLIESCISFELFVPIYAIIKGAIEKGKCSSITNYDDHLYNKPDMKDLVRYSTNIANKWRQIALELLITKPEIDVIIINNRNDVINQCQDMFTVWLQNFNSPCWCHFIKALDIVGLSDIAKKVIKTHLKQRSKSTVASVATSIKSNLVQDQNDTLNFHRLMRHLRTLSNNILDCDLYYFVTNLLPAEGAKLAEDIKHSTISREDKIKKICEEFLKEKDASWNRLHEALKEAGFDNLANDVKYCYL